MARQGSGGCWQKKALTPSARKFVPGQLHVQVMFGPQFNYLHSLNSFERSEFWSLGTSEMEVASVEWSGGTEGPQDRPLGRRAGGQQMVVEAAGLCWQMDLGSSAGLSENLSEGGPGSCPLVKWG